MFLYRECVECGEREYEEIASTGEHTESEWIVDTQATCYSEGYGHIECIHCHQVLTEGPYYAEHSYGTWNAEIPATCTEDGTYGHYYCSTCEGCFDKNYNVLYDLTIESKGHDCGDWIDEAPATCTDDGTLGHYHCSVCEKDLDWYGDELDSIVISATGHYTFWFDGFPATCTVDGEIGHFYCYLCEKNFDTDGNELGSIEITALGHSYSDDDWINEKLATCTEDGEIGHYHCTACNRDFNADGLQIYSTVIDAAGHDRGDWIYGYSATCTEDGMLGHYHCSVCERDLDRDESLLDTTVITATGHDYGDWINEVPATCTESGKLGHYHCSSCNKNFNINKKVISSLVITKKGHSFGEWYETLAPTCTEKGEERRDCKNCTYHETQEIDVKHNYVNDICTKCGEVIESKRLSFKLNSDNKSYSVIDIGTYTGTNLIIPDTYKGLPVTTICNNAFNNCTDITSLTIGSNITSIDHSAFYNCTALTEINYNATSCNDFNYKNYVFYNAGQSGDGIKVTIGANVETIPAYLFYVHSYSYTTEYSPKITEVIFEKSSSCKNIGNDAFMYCTALTSIIIPESVTYIGSSAFSGCTGLISVTIPSGLTSINDSVFYRCIRLKSITIPESVTSIGASAFFSCAALTEIDYNATNLESANGGAFFAAGKNGDGIKVTIGANVKKIPDYLFHSSTYSNSPKITEVVFEKDSNCESIGRYAFYNCANIKSVEIPESITSIGMYAFYGCTGLEKVNYNAIECSDFSVNNHVFSNAGQSGDGIKVTIGKEAKKILEYFFYSDYDESYLPKVIEVVFEEGSKCESIGKNAFYNCASLKSVEIAESITSIGMYAFYGCTGLEKVNYNAIECSDFSANNHVFSYAGQSGDGIKVTIGKDVKKISGYLFYSDYDEPCLPKITELIFEEDSSCESIGAYAFRFSSSLSNVTIPNSVISIGNRAFEKCIGFTSVIIPDSVESIGSAAFNECSNITTVIIGNGVTSIGSEAFSECKKIKSLILGNSVQSIGGRAFNSCSQLISITIPATVTSIGESSFNGCFKLVEVYNLSKVVVNTSSTVVGSLGYYAKVVHTAKSDESVIKNVNDFLFITVDNVNYLIAYVGNETDITLPEKYNGENYEIYGYAFIGCSSLTSVKIPDSITKIANGVFYNCTSLTSITIPSGITSIGSSAFYGCESLTSITIPNGTTNIGYNAFYNCTGLRSITIPESITSIGDHAFYNCASLTEINYNATSCDDLTRDYSSPSVFKDAGKNGDGIKLTIGANVTKIPQYLFCNAQYITEVVFEKGSVCESIRYYAFEGCTGLTSITIPDTVKSICHHAFNGCTGLTSVKIGNGVTLIGSNAFYGCTSLTDLTIGNGVATIDTSAFYGCTALTSVIIPDSVKTIDILAFSGCTGLTSVKIGSGVTSIGASAFKDCTVLNNIVISNNAISISSFAFNNTAYYNDENNWEDGMLYIGNHLIIAKSSISGEHVIKEGTITIAPYAFSGCTDLAGITIPDSVTSISNYAFRDCTGLTSVTIGSGVTSIDSYAFRGCTSLASITIPDSVTSIGSCAFLGCTSLTSVTIGSGVTSIGNYAFDDCTALTEINYNATNCDNLSSSNYVFSNAGENGDGIKVTIGANVKKIPSYLFCPNSSYYSPKIVEVVFAEDSVCESIRYYAFYSCTALTSITITDSVKNIDNAAFSCCTSLTTINYTGTETQWNSITKSYHWDNNTGDYTINYNYVAE